jgi:CRP/FNR family transcriptional regulator
MQARDCPDGVESCRVLAGLPKRELTQLGYVLHERSIAADIALFAPGDRSDAIYFIKSGFVRLFRLTPDGREVALGIAGPGDIFGDAALLDNVRRSTIAASITRLRVWSASSERFTSLLRSNPALAMRLTQEALRSREDLEARLAASTNASARSRLEYALLRFAESHGQRLASGAVRIPARLRHRDLASLAGIARETASNHISQLRRDGLLRIEADGSFSIVDLDRFASDALEPSA